MLFLVGGPGNGKSFLATKVVDGAPGTSPSASGTKGSVALRSYVYTGSPRDLVVINDATITRGDGSPIPLILDLDDAVNSNCDVLANANRGILVEELAGAVDKSAGFLIVAWLTDPTSSPRAWGPWHVTPGLSTVPTVRTATLIRNDAPAAYVTAVYMDVCSLLEERPAVSVDASTNPPSVAGSLYRVRRFSQRRASAGVTSPVSTLFASFIASIDASLVNVETPSASGDPFAANIASMRSAVVRSNLLSVLRAAEIAGGERYTYREIWGALVRCVVGQLPHELAQADPEQWLHLHRTTAVHTVERWNQYWALAQHRFSQALFGSSTAADDEDPVLRLTSRVDPTMDARPGRLRAPGAPTGEAGISGWVTPILDAFSGPSIDSSPLALLRASVASDDPVLAAIGEFEEGLDGAFVAAMVTTNLKDDVRATAIRNYGQYLTRLYALANGVPAFAEEIDIWTLAWSQAPAISEIFSEQLRTLLLPSRDPDNSHSNLVLPLFEARTVPIMGTQSRPRLAARLLSGWQLRTRREGDALFVGLFEADHELVELELDFALVRDASACSARRVGMTEFSQAAAPRLERFRSALLKGKQQANLTYAVVEGMNETLLSVEQS